VLGRPVGQVVGKDELMQCVWPDVVVGGSLTQSIADIRRALGDVDHRLVCNVARRGYQFVPDGAAAQPAERMSATSAIAGTARRQASSAWAARDSPLGPPRRHGRTTPSSRATRCHAVPALSIRSGPVCLNSFPRFISGLRAGCRRCRVVHGGGRRLRRTDRRGGQLGAHHGTHLMRPSPRSAAWRSNGRRA
jgi:hypothetical protein